MASRPEATIFHHPAWAAVLTDTYGFEPRLLAQTDGAGRIQAGAMFLDVRSRLTGRRLVSVPFTDHSPVIASDDEARRSLTAALVAWRRQEDLPRLEVHGELDEMPGVHAVPQGVRHVLPLGSSSESLYRSFSSQVGRAIRKAERSGVTISLETSREAVDQYFRLHVGTRRRQGVPSQPRRFFDRLWSRVIDEGYGFVATARLDGTAIAGAVFLGWNDRLIYKFGASDAGAWDVRPNNLLFWKVMERACEDGYEVLDFGKTEMENHGLREFKRRWGAEEVPLAYATLDDRPHSRKTDRTTEMVGRLLTRTPPVVGRAVGELLYRHFA